LPSETLSSLQFKNQPTIVGVAQAEKSIKITWEEFREMDVPEGDTSIYELLNGEIVIRSSPNSPHQTVSMNLSIELGNYNRKKN
jgi:Uma2 family endonuclease